MGPKQNSSKAELIDWYKKIPKKYLTKTHNPNFNKHGIEIPFRMLIIGGSGSGKTQTFLNILHNFSGTFQAIHLITKNKDEPLYNYLADELGKKGFEIHEGMKSAPDLDKFDKKEQTLIVFDDLVLEKNQSIIEEYYIRARKLNCSVIYLSQSYYAVPLNIRRNLTYLIIKRLQSLKDLYAILREYALGVDKKVLKKMYEESTGTKQDFLLVDMEAEAENRFRKNFNDIFNFDIEE
jgi:SpoVK/Ycf46/Vps4 family AAA+-type ATPase